MKARTFLYSLLLFTTVLAAVSCQKELSFDTPIVTPNPPSSGTCTICEYLPLCDSVSYTYIDTTSTGADSVKMTLRYLKDTSAFNLSYRKMLTTEQNFVQYIHCSDTLVQNFAVNAAGQSGTIYPFVKLTLLKPNLAVGSQWTDIVSYTVLGFTQTTFYNSTITQKNISRTIFGKTYNNVIEITVVTSTGDPLSGGLIEVNKQKNYFAKGVGAIETEYLPVTGSIFPAIKYHRVLKSYKFP